MLRIRRLGSDDLASFRAMNALFGEVFNMPREYCALPPRDDYAQHWLSDTSNIAVIAENEGRIVGALAGYVLSKFEQERSELFIYDLAVREDSRRRGIATNLIEEVRRIARQTGAWTVFVGADTGSEDAPAQTLYRKLAREESITLHYDIAP